MTVSITHATVAVGANDPTKEVSSTAWNQDHTVTGLGTAAEANTTDFATAAQGALADSAVQPGDLGDLALKDKAAIADIDATGTPGSGNFLRGDGTWSTPSSSGDMLKATYDPTNIAASPFARANHTGTQTASTISDFSTAADARVSAAIGVSVQAYAANLTSWAAVAPASYLTTATAASTYQPLDSDLTTIAGLTATTDNFIVSVSSAWASRTPAQVRTTLGLVIGTNVQAYSSVLANTTASFTTTLETKLNGIEALADVTDAANVDAAGAVMNTDTSTASMSFVIDEDNMASDSATKVPTQQSVKAYVDANAGGSGKHSLWIPATAMRYRTTNGAAPGAVEMSTNKNMFVTLDFDTTTQEFAQFAIRMPKSWNESTVTFAPVWSHASTTTNFGVAFGLAGVAISNDDAGDVAFGSAQTSVDTGGTTNDIYEGPESSAITIAGSPAAGDYVMFQVNRTVSDGGDTMAIDARLHGIVLFITTDAGNDA